jgi:hypothetical protein
MGGRGRSSGLGKRQFTFSEDKERRILSGIINDSARTREALLGEGSISSDGASRQVLKKCVCCGEYTIPVGSTYGLCSNCGWIDDPYQNHNPESLNGKNSVSLTQARENYKKRRKRFN